MSESRVLTEIEMAAAAFKICVLPRNPKRLAISVWSLPDPKYHVGVIWRQNTGALKQNNRFIRFGIPGLPDFLGWLFADGPGDPAKQRLVGQFLTIEAKDGKATASLSQAAFSLLATKTGALNGIARSYDEACALFASWGLKRV